MRLLLQTVFILFFSISISAQTPKSLLNNQQQEDSYPLRNITDNGLNGVEVSYSFNNVREIETNNKKEVFNRLFVDGYSHLQEVGLPAMPAHIDLVVVPEGATYKLKIYDQMPEVVSTKKIFPTLQPARDTEGAPEPKFEINSDFYETDQLYPSQSVKIIGTMVFRGIKFLKVQTCPVQYNPAKGKLYLHKNINYKITFSGAESYTDYANHTENYIKQLLNYPLNSSSWKKEANSYYSSMASVVPISGPSKNYIIITHSNYLAAADSIANWKRQMGYTVEVVSSNTWTSSTVKAAVHNRYANWTPKPDYLLIIGDHQDVPAEMIYNPANELFGTDLYYVCMDGNNDYVPDMAKGRISAANAASAMMQVQKIINYERNPINDTVFYENAVNCAQYQDDDNDGYADRRFLHTSENIRDYIMTQGYSSQRLYYCDNTVYPAYYNNGYYSNGQAIPSDILKTTGFSWSSGATDITNSINAGKFLVFHRDHGYSGGGGWAHPYYVNSSIASSSLNNGNKLPVVFSINCHTGEFTLNQCFAESFMRKQNAGAVGVIAASYYSYSGNNDGFSLGMIDGIWSNPGLLPLFGNGGVNSPSVNAHSDIVRLGDVVNHGLVRMVQTWGGSNSSNRYSYELFHYFGDPAMKIWTAQPDSITALVSDTIHCTDTSFTINNCSDSNAVVSLMGNGALLGRTTLVGGNGTLYLNNLQGAYFTLTITARNKRPFIKRIFLGGGNSLGLFSSSIGNKCFGDSLGSLHIFPACGQPPYQINWSNGDTTNYISNLTKGVYTVVVTDANGNVIYDTLSVDGPSSPLHINSIVKDAKCYFQSSGSIEISLNGGMSPYNILWSNTANSTQLSNLAPGNYSVVVTDSFGCEISEMYTINEPPALDMTTSFTDDSTNNCIGTATCNPIGGTLPYTYSWNDPNNQTTATATGLCAGMYKISLSDSNNCITYRTLFIHNTVGIENNSNEKNINIYPNPVINGIFNIEFKNANGEIWNINLYNSIGELIEIRQVKAELGSNEVFNISNYSAGIYYIILRSDSSVEKVFKLIVE